MSAKQEAAAFDAEDRPVEAAAAYERAITNSETDLDTHINLAVLYFVCNDYGYATQHKLSDSFVASAWDRAMGLLEQAEQRFGSHPEIEFWRRYFAFVVLGEEPFYEEAERLANTGATLVPFLHLISSPMSKRFREQDKKLLDSVGAGVTAKERYIKSVLESPAHDDRAY